MSATKRMSFRIPALAVCLIGSLLLVACLRSPKIPIRERTVVSEPVSNTAIKRDLIFALLANGNLVGLRAEDGRLVANYDLAAAQNSLDAIASTGHYLGTSKDGTRLFALISGSESQPSHVYTLDVATRALRPTHDVEDASVVFRSLAVGPQTGRVYLFGNQRGDVVVAQLDANADAELKRWTVKRQDSFNWWIYQGAVGADERQLFISYHGVDTTGIDWMGIASDTLKLCTTRQRPDMGCINSHGSFVFYKNSLLTATGEEPILQHTQQGKLLGAFDAGLQGNHLMEIALDVHNQQLYAVGSCGYVGGVTRINLEKPGSLESMSDTWKATPYPPRRLAPRAVCGERLALSRDGSKLVIGVTARPVPSAYSPGALKLIDTTTGELLWTTETEAEPVDVILVPQ